MIDPIYIGAPGAALVLIAFVLGQKHIWKDTWLSYDLVNLLGSILLGIYAVTLGSWPFIITNLVWGSISLKDVITDFIRNEHKKSPRNFWRRWME